MNKNTFTGSEDRLRFKGLWGGIVRHGFALMILAMFFTVPFVFAQEFTLQGAMETVFVPVQVQTNEDGGQSAQTGLGVFGYSPNGGARFKFMANASLDRIGLISYLRFYTTVIDNTQNRLDTIWLGVWVKPVDWLRFDVGSIEDWTLWGSFGQPTFAPYTQRSKDEDVIFTEFYYPSGFLMTIKPNDNLFIGVGLPALKSKNPDNPSSYNPSYLLAMEDSEKAYERIQAAVGYTIDGIGLARIQYVGANPAGNLNLKPIDDSIDTDSTPDADAENIFPVFAGLPSISSYAKIEGAFAYKGTPGLLVDVGFKIPIAFKEYDSTFLAPYQISGGVKVKTGNFGIESRVDGKFGSEFKLNPDSDYKIKFAPEINFHLTPSYTLDSLVIGLDCGVEWYGEAKDQDGNVLFGNDGGARGGIGAFVQKNFGPACYVVTGIGYHFGGKFNSVDQMAVFTIPIIFNYTSPKASLVSK
jgi:hypothetical protein